MEVRERYKNTEIGLIPEDWEYFTFKDISWVNQGLQIPISQRLTLPNKNSKVYITIQYLNDGKTVEYIDDFVESVCCNKEDILMTRTGNTGIVISGVEGVFHNNFFKINFNREKVDKNFLIYYLNQSKTKKIILAKAGTSTIPDLNHKDFYSIPITLPPTKDEQRLIAAALSDADFYITALEKLITKKRSIKQGAMQELLTGKRRLPGFAGEWVEKCGILEFHKGVQCKALEIGEYPHYNGGQTNSSFTDDYNAQDKIIISEGGNSCGYVNYINRKFWAGGHCYVVDENSFNKMYLYNLLKLYEPQIMGLRVGSGLPNVQSKGLRELQFWYTIDTAEQTAIATILSDMDAEIDALTAKLEKARHIKQGMMGELLTGRIRLIEEDTDNGEN